MKYTPAQIDSITLEDYEDLHAGLAELDEIRDQAEREAAHGHGRR